MSQSFPSEAPALSIKSLKDFLPGIEKIYSDGMPKGCSSGWYGVDPLYRVHKAQLAIVTGIPGSGKSEWLDAMAVNLVRSDKWHVAFFSPENRPEEYHCVKHLEKMTGKKFIGGPMSDRSFADHFGHVRFIGCTPSPTLERILDDAKVLALGMIEGFPKLDMLVLDPWNEIEHKRPQNMSETEYISDTLSKLKHFAHFYDVAVFLVAHPAKMAKDKNTGLYPCPTPYDISGSAHWRNKADVCIAVHRPDLTADTVEVHVQKIRFKHVGRTGGPVILKWDRDCGRFSDSLSY